MVRERFDESFDVVEPPRGRQHTGLIGKIGAAVAGVLIVAIGYVAYTVIRNSDDGFPVYLEEVSETIESDPGCIWTVDAVLRNDGDEQVTVDWIETVLNRDLIRGQIAELPTIAPGATEVATIQWSLGPPEGCPDVDALDHGNLIMHFDNGTKASRWILKASWVYR